MMMKTKKLICILFAIILCSCTGTKKKVALEVEIDSLRTTETQNLLKNLALIPTSHGYMFGHQDATVYGIGWEGDSARSDVKSVCGDYPAVCGWEIGRIELGQALSLDKVPFDRIRYEIIQQFLRGGMNTISWHVDNPVTGGDSWDIKGDSVVKSILPDGNNHTQFISWLDKVVIFLNSLETPDGIKIPVLLRPWHEHTGSWFWWGKDYCTPEQYKKLWIMTHDYFQSKGVKNIIYAYSPGGGGSAEEYMERYPGDQYVDILGFDYYQLDGERGTNSYIEVLNSTLTYLTQFGKQHNKPIAVTETGLEALPVSNWWTEVLHPLLDKYPISYVLLWRNARERPNHYYAPYPGQLSEQDFIKFYNLPQTRFGSDIDGLYQ